MRDVLENSEQMKTRNINVNPEQIKSCQTRRLGPCPIELDVMRHYRDVRITNLIPGLGIGRYFNLLHRLVMVNSDSLLRRL